MGRIKDYIDARLEQGKLLAADGLSSTIAAAITIFLTLVLLMVVLTTLAFGAVLLIGELIGSYAAGAFIVSGVFLVLTLICWLLRKKLFRSMFIKMLLKDEGIRNCRELHDARIAADAKAEVRREDLEPTKILNDWLGENSEYINWNNLLALAIRTIKEKCAPAEAPEAAEPEEGADEE
ncbi:MAG: hypothetical protein J5771_07405 [Bacteroidales bacterium]|nr:hypothetical protein [Bacteroidales bacterium]